MLGSQHRLRSSAEILQTIREGTRVRLPAVTLYIRKNNHEDSFRVACIAGKRVHASSVVRHAVQRRLRAASRAIVPFFLSSCDMVVVASDVRVLTANFQTLIKDMYYAIRQCGV